MTDNEIMKTCKTCKAEKSEGDFYRNHGRLELSCKACRIKKMTAKRDEDPERWRISHLEAVKRSQAKNMTKRNARAAVNNAIKDGRMEAQPCLMCGDNGEAHHPDYSRPLDVVWLCKKHHHETHVMARLIS